MKHLFPVFFLLSSVCFGQGVQFTSIAETSGIDYIYLGTGFGQGISFYDFNKDGLDDITFGGGFNEAPHFYLNTGSGFSEIQLSGVDMTEYSQKCLLWVDYDNDGDLDLSSNNFQSSGRLYRNDGGFNFTDVSSSSEFSGSAMNSYAGMWSDLDLDGDLDHYATTREPSAEGIPNRLMTNLGNGQFNDITEISMVADSQGLGFGVVASDFNKDGWPDIYIANDKFTTHNTLFQNMGNGLFEDVSDSQSTGIHMDGMGVGTGDYDGNGYEDFYVTNTPISSIEFGGNVLCQNHGNNTFSDMAGDLGLRVFEIGWGSSWADFNNDGHLDLFVANERVPSGAPNTIFINQGDGTFEEDTTTLIHSTVDNSFGTAVGDLNDDGYPDIAVMNVLSNSVKIWSNNGGTNTWVKVSLEGTVSNSEGIGAWIETYSMGHTNYRYTHCGNGYGSQDGRKAMFGLGNASVIDSIIVRWPSGIVDKAYDLAVNQSHHFTESVLVSTFPKDEKTEWLSVYPNPSNETVSIQYNGSDKMGTIKLTDVMGRVVYSQRVLLDANFHRYIDFNVNPGSYVLQIIENEEVATTRLEVR